MAHHVSELTKQKQQLLESQKIFCQKILEPLNVLTTQGVTEIMQNEAREAAELKLQNAAKLVKESTGTMPVLHIREGEIISELIKLIEEEENINVLVLSANNNNQYGVLIAEYLFANA